MLHKLGTEREAKSGTTQLVKPSSPGK